MIMSHVWFLEPRIRIEKKKISVTNYRSFACKNIPIAFYFDFTDIWNTGTGYFFFILWSFVSIFTEHQLSIFLTKLFFCTS